MWRPAFSIGILTLALCMSSAAAQTAVTLDPPTGWKPVDLSSLPIKYEGAWAQATAPDGHAQSLNLLKQTVPAATEMDAYVDATEKQLQAMDPKIAFNVNERLK